MARRLVTPWGLADLVEEVTIPQRAGESRFATVVQLVELGAGERVVRFTCGRNAVALRTRDLERLRIAVEDGAPGIAAEMGWGR